MSDSNSTSNFMDDLLFLSHMLLIFAISKRYNEETKQFVILKLDWYLWIVEHVNGVSRTDIIKLRRIKHI